MTNRKFTVDRQSYESITSFWLDAYQDAAVVAYLKPELDRRRFEQQQNQKMARDEQTSNLRALESRYSVFDLIGNLMAC